MLPWPLPLKKAEVGVTHGPAVESEGAGAKLGGLGGSVARSVALARLDFRARQRAAFIISPRRGTLAFCAQIPPRPTQESRNLGQDSCLGRPSQTLRSWIRPPRLLKAPADHRTSGNSVPFVGTSSKLSSRNRTPARLPVASGSSSRQLGNGPRRISPRIAPGLRTSSAAPRTPQTQQALSAFGSPAVKMSGEAWLYLLAVLINAVNLFLQVFFTIMYSDLEWYVVAALSAAPPRLSPASLACGPPQMPLRRR